MAERVKMVKYLDETPLNSLDIEPIDRVRADELAEIMLDAYRDTPDYEGEGFVETIEELDNVFAGYYGTFMAKNSLMGLDDDGRIAAAILLCLYKNEPTITYQFTSKGNMGKGYATALINAASRTLKLDSFDKIFVYVNTSNGPAHKLYRTMGFVQIPINSSAIDKELMEEIREREIALLESEKLKHYV